MSSTLDLLISLLRDRFNAGGELTGKTAISGVGLDSLDTISFLFTLEEETGVRIPDEILSEGSLETLEQLAEYVNVHKPEIRREK